MATARDEPADLIDDAIIRIAERAKVPIERRVDFCAALPGLFKLARTWHEWDVTSAPKRKAIDRQLKQLEKDATAFKAMLEGLDDAARKTLGIYARRHELFGAAATDEQLRFQVMDLIEGGQVEIGLSRVGLFTKVVDDIRTAASTREWPPSSAKGGAPSKSLHLPGNPNVRAFDLFVIELERLVYSQGGRTTLDKNYGTGTLIKIIDVARPHLPNDFVPDKLKLSRLRRLQQQARPTGQKPLRK